MEALHETVTFARFNHRIKRRLTYGVRKCLRIRVYLDVAEGGAIETSEGKNRKIRSPIMSQMLLNHRIYFFVLCWFTRDDGLSVFV